MKKQPFRGVSGKTILFLALLFTAISVPAQEWQLKMLHSFGNAALSANFPISGVILGSDKEIYGTTFKGGTGQAGVIFQINSDGSGFQVIHNFSSLSNSADGAFPQAGLLEASDGRLYGTTTAGGTNSTGTIFSVNRDGSDFQVIYNFEFENVDADPAGELIEGMDGSLYGTTSSGGPLSEGTVFRINKDGSDYEVIHEFDSATGQGAFPRGPVVQGSDGALYGCANDEEYDSTGGKIFKMQTDGSGYQVIHDFDIRPGDGSLLLWGLIEGRDGMLYGTTYMGGTGQGGIVFKLRKDGTGYQVLWNFGTAAHQPSAPFGPLHLAPDGLLYGLSEYGGPERGGTFFALDEKNSSLQVIDSFGSGSRDAAVPIGALAQDAKGNFFGVSRGGGLAGDGTIFLIPTHGNHEILHNFNSSGGDGAYPNSTLYAINVGAFPFYGTTTKGGIFGQGTAFQINYDGTGYKLLQSFSDQPIGIVPDQAGSNFYVTTIGPGPHGQGALYRMKPNGALKLLHRFRGPPTDGANPGVPFDGEGGIYQSPDGMLYGVTLAGGKANSGIIYRVGIDGTDYRILHQFDGLNGVPGPVLIEGDDGGLYGTTAGTSPGISGTAFKIKRDGTGYTILHTFNPGDPGGPNPSGPLVETGARYLYGTTQNSPSPVIYIMSSDGSLFGIEYTFTNYSGPVTGLNCPQNDESIYLYGAAPGYQNGVIFTFATGGPDGFQIIRTLGSPDVEPSVSVLGSTYSEPGVITTQGGDMNIGQIFQLLQPPLLSRERPIAGGLLVNKSKR